MYPDCSIKRCSAGLGNEKGVLLTPRWPRNTLVGLGKAGLYIRLPLLFNTV